MLCHLLAQIVVNTTNTDADKAAVDKTKGGPGGGGKTPKLPNADKPKGKMGTSKKDDSKEDDPEGANEATTACGCHVSRANRNKDFNDFRTHLHKSYHYRYRPRDYHHSHRQHHHYHRQHHR